jgi:hypothetical protein
MMSVASRGRLVAVLLALSVCIAASEALRASEAQLIPARVGIGTLSKQEQVNLWKRVDDWATADSLLEFCGTKLNIYKRGWNAVTQCVETQDLRKVGNIFRAKKNSYIKILEGNYPDAEKKKAFCDGMGPRLKDYARIINAQIAEAKGMCDACLWC